MSDSPSVFYFPGHEPRDEGPPIDPPGGGGDDGSMEQRVARLEVQVDHLRADVTELKADVRELRRDVTGIRTTDFRILFGAIIAVALGLAGLMAKGFKWL